MGKWGALVRHIWGKNLRKKVCVCDVGYGVWSRRAVRCMGNVLSGTERKVVLP